MLIFNELTEDNLFLYAAKHYYNPQFSDIDEFHEDLKRFKYIKRLANRYLETGELAERLMLNHLIVVFNVSIVSLRFSECIKPNSKLYSP